MYYTFALASQRSACRNATQQPPNPFPITPSHITNSNVIDSTPLLTFVCLFFFSPNVPHTNENKIVNMLGFKVFVPWTPITYIKTHIAYQMLANFVRMRWFVACSISLSIDRTLQLGCLVTTPEQGKLPLTLILIVAANRM
jgi:hypothetical protein